MSTLHIYRGIPASGKSTAALEWVAEDPENRVRVNRDDIRLMCFGKYWGVDENYVTKVQTDLLIAAFKAKRDAVLDATNLKAKNLKSVLALAEKWGYGVEFRDFPIELHVAIERDKGREKPVGEDVIKSFYDRYTRKGKLPPVPKLPEPYEFTKYVPDEFLPAAIIVDIDGTLAHMQGRSPYDDKLLHTDTVDEIVRSIVWKYRCDDYRIIVMSGRDEGKCRTATEEWLARHFIDYDQLIMRPAGDKKNDAIVKSELFDKYVAPHYNVRFTLDDRDRVVAAWRAKGIKCLQVAPGAF